MRYAAYVWMPDRFAFVRTRLSFAPIAVALLAALSFAPAAVASSKPGLSPVAAAAAAKGRNPPSHPCHVPRLLGLERPLAESALYDYEPPACNGLRISHVSIRHVRRHGRLIVISQTPRAGTPFTGRREVHVTLEVAPPLPHGCRTPAYYQLIAHGPRLIVWKIARNEGEDGEEFSETYYACVPPTGRKVAFATSFHYLTCGGSVSQLQFAGSYAALVDSSGCQYGSTTTVRVLDARSGHTADVTVSEPFEATPTDLQHLGSPVGMGAGSLVLDAYGDVAWIGETAERGTPPHEMVLYLHDGQGTQRLATAPSIIGLAFRGTRLVWQEGALARAVPR